MRKFTYILLSIILFVNSQIAAKEPNSTISFCNEVLPLHEPIVMKCLDQALHRTGNSILTDIRRNAPQYFNIIDPILVHYQVPADFKYLCIAESGFTQNAKSSKGAVGFWQFMPETARAMGLVVNGKIDDRQNLRKSTAAACRYFRQLYHELGSWTLVAAAYNAGPTKMKEYLRINGKRNFYQWSIYSETRKYLYRVVAIKEMISRPSVYESMLTYKTPLRIFLKNQGTLLGLMEWPISTLSKASEVVWKSKNTTSLTISQELVSGFDNFVPIVYKRYLFGSSPDYSISKIIEPSQEIAASPCDFSCSDELAIQWVTLPFYSRRRLEDYLLPADPKVTISKKINRRYLEFTA